MRVLFVQESIEDCLQGDFFAIFSPLTQALNLAIYELFSLFCNHGLNSSFSSHMSGKLVLYFTFNIILNWKKVVSQSYSPNMENYNQHFNNKLTNNNLQFFRRNLPHKLINSDERETENVSTNRKMYLFQNFHVWHSATEYHII